MDHDHAEHPPDGSPRVNAPPRPFALRAALALVWAGCAIYALFFLYHGAVLVSFPYDIDNSEGFLLYQAKRIADGGFLYPPLEEQPYLVDNYPPLYPFIGSLGAGWAGVNFHWLRFISLASTLGCAGLIAWWTWMRTRRPGAGALAALVFLSFYHVYQWGALARVDSLGLMLSLAGLAVFERWGRWGPAAFLFSLALFAKQSLFAAPLGVFIALLLIHPRRALWFATVLLFIVVMLFEFIMTLSTGEAWNHLVVYNANAFYWQDVFIHFRHWAMMYTVWGGAMLALMLIERPGAPVEGEQKPNIWFWFALGSIGEGLLCGKIGSAPNYLLSMAAASAVAVGSLYAMAVPARNDTSQKSAVCALFAAAMLFQLASTVHLPGTSLAYAYTPTSADRQAGQWVERRLAEINGPVLSDLCGTALLAGKEPAFQPFICTQLSQEGKWNQAPLLADIRAGRYSWMVMRFDIFQPDWDRRRFTPEMIEAMRETYQAPQRIAPYFIYQARS